jgi:beta-galactosidase
MKTIEIQNKNILIDEQPVQIISGAIHYFRVHPDLWADRLDKAVALGLNCIETYIAWNLHEPKRGEFDFAGIADIERFVDLAQERGLHVILRPGPFICAEWENGGFPAWLNAVPGIQLRRLNQPYLAAVTAYFDVLLPKLRAKLHTNGGPVIMVSLENEYGSFCHDKDYLHTLLDLYRRHGIDVPIFTNDGPCHHHLLGGSIPEALVTMDFGSRSEKAWQTKEYHRPGTPDFCMEFWDGWFDHWGEKHHTRAAGSDESAEHELEKMLAAGAHLNIYMFHGGTNFGFTNGANGHFYSDYQPTVTSYDYDALLSECGDPTDKFRACQAAIKKHTDNPRIAPIRPTTKIAPEPVALTGSTELFANLDLLADASGEAMQPPTMEQLSQNGGFIHYRKRLAGPLTDTLLRLYHVNDYAQVWLDGHYLGHRMRDDGQNPFTITIGPEGAMLDLLVENCGRINYGPFVGKDPKGITHAVTTEFQEQIDWEYRGLPLENLDGLTFGEFRNEAGAVRFHRGEFTIEETGDTFLRRPGGKGSVWINGFHLGRYWEIGPTQTLYVPAPVLRKGQNTIIVMEQEGLESATLAFQDHPDLGSSE